MTDIVVALLAADQGSAFEVVGIWAAKPLSFQSSTDTKRRKARCPTNSGAPLAHFP